MAKSVLGLLLSVILGCAGGGNPPEEDVGKDDPGTPDSGVRYSARDAGLNSHHLAPPPGSGTFGTPCAAPDRRSVYRRPGVFGRSPAGADGGCFILKSFRSTVFLSPRALSSVKDWSVSFSTDSTHL